MLYLTPGSSPGQALRRAKGPSRRVVASFFSTLLAPASRRVPGRCRSSCHRSRLTGPDGRAQQSKTSSSATTAVGSSAYRIAPESFRVAQAPQLPDRQLKGGLTPRFSANSRRFNARRPNGAFMSDLAKLTIGAAPNSAAGACLRRRRRTWSWPLPVCPSAIRQSRSTGAS
jgi:hypothetical protein